MKTREPSLREFQQWMKAQIIPGRKPLAQNSPLNPQAGTPGHERMHVYAGGYLTRIHSALEEVFEAVHHVLGEGAFFELAESYAQQFPSQDYNLSLSGRHLPEFLRTWKRTEELPFLPDLAKLEWQVCAAFHSFDRPALDGKHLLGVSPEKYEHLKLEFQPSVGLIESAWPILDIWQARKQPREAININLINRPQRVLVYRKQIQVMCEPVNAAQSALLSGLLQGKTLGEACTQLADQAEAPPLSEWFSTWMSLGLITRYHP